MIKCAIQETDIRRVSSNVNTLQSSEEEVLRNRVFIVEQAIKNRVQYNEILQFRLKSDKIDLSDLSQELKDQFLNDSTIARLEEMIDKKVGIEELEKYLSIADFDKYKKYLNNEITKIESTMHTHHDECMENHGYVLGLIENKIDDDDFALLEDRVKRIENTGGTGNGGSVDLTVVNSRLSALEDEDIIIKNSINSKADRVDLVNYREKSTLIEENDLSESLKEKINSIDSGNPDIDLSDYATVEMVNNKVTDLTSSINNKVDISTLAIEMAKKANVSHTHDNYATTSSLNSLSTKVDDIQDQIDGIVIPESPDVEGLKADVELLKVNKVDKTELSTELAKKADKTHTHNEYASSSSLNTLTSRVDTIEEELANVQVPDLSTIETNISNLQTSKADKTELTTELAKKADKTHTHNEYATNTALQSLTNTVGAIQEELEGIVIPEMPDLSTIETNISNLQTNKADKTHTHDNYVENSVITSLTDIVNGLKAEITALTNRVKLLEGLHEGELPDPNIEWEHTFEHSSASGLNLTFNMYQLEGMEGRRLTFEDVFGENEDNVNRKFQMFNCGTTSFPNIPIKEIPNVMANRIPEEEEFIDFDFNPDTGLVTFSSAIYGRRVNIKLVKYKEGI